MRRWIYVLGVLTACSGGAGDPALEIDAEVPEGRVGEVYSATFEVTGASSPKWAIEGLPEGLRFTPDATRAEVEGVPEAAGTFAGAVRVTDGEREARRAFVIVVRPGSITIVTESLPAATAEVPYVATIEAVGGSGERTWRVEGLPEGFSAMADDAVVIRGTPSEIGTSSIEVHVADASGEDMQTLDLVVAATSLVLDDTVIPVGYVDTPYRAPLHATGGRAPYTWTIDQGPAGITVDDTATATCAVIGTPQSVGRASVVVRVQDRDGASATGTFTLDVTEGPLEILTSTLTDAWYDHAYGTTIAFRPGVGAHTWTITNGAPPAGLRLVVSGSEARIEGTPTDLRTGVFTLEVEDERGQIDTQRFMLFVTPDPPLVITTLSLPTVEVGLPVELPIAAAGGATPYTWMTSGTLPTGLEVDAIGTPTTFVRGVPTRLEREDVEVTVLDRNGRRASRRFTIEVTPSVQPLSIVTTSPPSGSTCHDYLFELEGAGGSRTDYVWSLLQGSLPNGIVFDADDALFVGVPQVTGSFPFVIGLTDGVGESTTASMTLEVTASSGPRFGLVSTGGSSERRLFPLDLCGASFALASSINQPQAGDGGLMFNAPVVFSPAGDRAAYVAQENGETRLYVVDLSGAAPVTTAATPPMMTGPFGVAWISWSPSGAHVALVGELTSPGYAAWIIDVTQPQNPGPAIRVSPDLAPTGNVWGDVVWSPDGQRFAFIGDVVTPNVFEVFVGETATASTSVRSVSGVQQQQDEVRRIPPVWAIDSAHVLFAARLRTDRIEVFAVDVRDAMPAPFPILPSAPAGSATYSPLELSPDGTRFVYVASQAGTGAFEPYLVELRSPPYTPERIGPPLPAGTSPNQFAWSRASDRLLYVLPASGGWSGALNLVDVTQPDAITRLDVPGPNGGYVENQAGAFSFDASGTRVAFLSDISGVTDAYFVSVASSMPTMPERIGPLLTGHTTTQFVWSTDAPRLALVTQGSPQVGVGQLQIVNLTDGAPGRSRRVGESLNTAISSGPRRLHLRAGGAVVYFSTSTGSAHPVYGAFTAGPTNGAAALLVPSIFGIDSLHLP